MSIEDDIFLKYKPEISKLKKYGFSKKEHVWQLEKIFSDNEFKAVIKITEKGNVTGSVYDIESNDEFLPLRVEDYAGTFAGKIKNEYSEILTNIRDNCFSELVFVSEQGNRIAKLIKDKYNNSPLFMWKDSPTCGVFKNTKTKKWYGIIMYIKRNKIDSVSNDMVEIMNVKLEKDNIQNLLKRKGFYPAYHMNKKYWITITLDETLSDENIMEYISESYCFSLKK